MEQKLQEILEKGCSVKIDDWCWGCGGDVDRFRVTLIDDGKETHDYYTSFQSAIDFMHLEAYPSKPLTNDELIEKIEKWAADREYHRIPAGQDMTERDGGFSDAISRLLDYLKTLKSDED